MARLLCTAVLMVLIPLPLKAQNTTLAPAQIVANEGENATFVCSPFITAARPTLFSTDPGSMNIELVPSSDNRVLSIDNVNVGRTYVWLRVNRTLDHLRKFYCDVNSVRSNASTLTVNFPPTYNNLGPLAVNTQEGIKDFKIDLPLSSRPSPVFEWTLNNNVIQETANRMLTASSLRLATVDRADRGKYVVSANNSAGSDTVTIILNITYTPRFNAETTTVSFRPREDATLDCSVDSNPTADISISTPSGSTTSSTPDGMITISNIMTSDAGIYTCRANNSIGTEVILTYTVEVGGPPGPITDITSRVDKGTIILSWRAADDNGVMITEYNIIIKRGATTVLTKMSTTTSVSVTRNELRQTEDEKNMIIEYAAQVYATNLQGNGSSVSTSFTLNAVESGSATLVSTTALLSILLVLCISLFL